MVGHDLQPLHFHVQHCRLLAQQYFQAFGDLLAIVLPLSEEALHVQRKSW